MSVIDRDIDLIVIVRKEQDSNLRSPLGAYTLSRRASSTTRAPFHLIARIKHCAVVALAKLTPYLAIGSFSIFVN